MLSDALRDGIDDIRHYQRQFPECYSGMREWIDEVVREMEGLARYLDLCVALDAPGLQEQVLATWKFLHCKDRDARKWLQTMVDASTRDSDKHRAWLANCRRYDEAKAKAKAKAEVKANE